MAATLVQSAKGTSTSATVTASFSSTPTNGNLVVLCFAADDYNGTPNSGWTQSTGMEQQTFHGSYLWWRVASGGSNSFQYTIGSASPSSWVLLEISGLDGSPYDISNGQYATGTSKTYSTPALTPSAGDRILVAAVNFNRNSGTLAGNTVTGWTNSFAAVDSIGSGPSGTNTTASLATRSVTANGSTSYSTSGTSDIDVTSASGLIIAFKVASGGGGQSITGSLFTNTNSFYGSTVGRGSVNISGALYSDADTFYAATLGKTYAITGSRFDNSAQFYAATVAPGTVTISGALFTDGDAFYAATIGRGAVDIAGALYTDPDSFYAASVGQAGAPQNIDCALFSNANAFYGSSVSASYTVSGALYSDADAFYAATVSVSYAISGALYTDADTFFAASISQPNTPQTITGQLYANDNQFFGAVVDGGKTFSATSSGGVGTTWARKTLSQIEREKKAALKRAKKRVVQIIEADPPQLGELLQIVREEVRQEAVEFPSTVVNDIISRLHMQMRAALIRRIEEEDEADAEFLLLVA